MFIKNAHNLGTFSFKKKQLKDPTNFNNFSRVAQSLLQTFTEFISEHIT